jgi:O-antigen/teichoic acid export membrane protein
MILTIPYIIHHLGSAKFGIFALLKVLVDYFGVCELGLGGATTRYIAEAKGNNRTEEITRIYHTSLVFIILLGLAGTIVFYFFIPILAEHFLKVEASLVLEMVIISRIGSSLIFIVLVKSLLNGVLEAFQRFDLINIIKIPYLIALSLIPVIAIYLGYGLTGIAVGIVFVEAVTLIGYYLLSKRLIPNKGLKFLDWYSFMPILSFGCWLSATRVITWIMLNIQNIIIGALISAVAITYYNIPYNLVSKIAIIGGSIAPILFAAVSFLNSRGIEKMHKLSAYSLKYTIIVYGLPALICMLFSKEILILWLGSSFQQSVAVMKILAIGILFSGISWILGTFIQSIGKPKLITIIGMFQFPLDIFITWFLIKHFGILGAAFAWTSLRILTVIIYYILCKRFDILNLTLKITTRFLQGLGYLILLIGLIYIVKYSLYLSILSALLNILIFIIGYLLIIWNYSIEEQRKVLFINKFGFVKEMLFRKI